MSYARRRTMGSNRIIAITFVAVIHMLLGYALITGLAYTVIQKAADDLKTFNVEKEPPPPEVPPPPPPEKAPQAPPIVSPPPIVRTEVAPPKVETVPANPPRVTLAVPPAPPAPQRPITPPPPPPKQTVPPRSAVGNLQGLFRGDDYPQTAIEYDEEGSVVVRLTVGTDGSVESCDVASSSGSRTLDRATCRILKNRASFTPARDEHGNLTSDTVRQRIDWVLVG